MIYPTDIESKLSFDKIKLNIQELCRTDKAKQFVGKLQFVKKKALLDKLLTQTREYTDFLSSSAPISIFISSRISDILQRANIIGSYLSEDEAFELRTTINSFSNAYVTAQTEDAMPSISELCDDISISNHLISELNHTINDKGKISDLASPELKKIRQQIISESGQVRKNINAILKNAQKEGWAEDGIEPSIRNGRLVIPLAAEYKRKIKGLIHDVSGTGQTVFLEPASVVDMNNKIFELNQEERMIIAKILVKLTSLIREEILDIRKGIEFLTQLDFIQAKCLFGNKINATVPHISEDGTSNWVLAFHPLLYLSYQNQDKKVEPFSIEFNKDQRIIIISGPNAGGKSVCLKATGLIQYMFQCGLPVPMHESSSMKFYERIFADIGDDQSIEDDLSTYSGHLKNMRFFIRNADKNTLFLIDEFGTGTDPTFGGAIAEGILKELDQKQCQGIITTHYENIKEYANARVDIVNASMQYDLKNLQPLYKLQIGQPGSSYTIQIAEKMQLPKEVIAYASQKLGTKKVDYERMIQQLEREKTELQDKLKENQKKEANLKKVTAEYEELKEHIQQERKRILKKAETEALHIVSGANKAIENTITSIRKTQADKEKTKEARKRLDAIKKKLATEEIKEAPKDTHDSFALGDHVKTSSGTEGEIISINAKSVILAIGNLKTTAKISELTKVGSAKQHKDQVGVSSVKMLNTKIESGLQLDVRGKRPDEVMSELDRFLNETLMQGHERITILHGKGHGVLRQVTRNYLKEMSFVDRYESEDVEAGGDGITVVYMK